MFNLNTYLHYFQLFTTIIYFDQSDEMHKSGLINNVLFLIHVNDVMVWGCH